MAPKLKVQNKVLKHKASRKLPNQASSFVACPVCEAQVAISLINLHLDLDCEPNKRKDSPKKKFAKVSLQRDDEAPLLPIEQAKLEEAVLQQGVQSSIFQEDSPKLCSQDNDGSEGIMSRSFQKYLPSPTGQAYGMKGHQIVEEFISPEEEEHLLFSLDMDQRNPWKPYTFSGLNRGKAYGLVTDLRRREVLSAKFDMPQFLKPIIRRMRSIPILVNFFPNEMNSLEYCKDEGHFLRPHVDDRQLSGTLIVNLSLCGECCMTFKRERGAYECYQIQLNRRSLQILSGESRYNFTHSIENESLLSARRVSLTFREVLLV